MNRFARTSSNYASWMTNCPFECEVVESYAPDWQVPSDAGLVVTHMHYRWEEISALRRIYETTRVPILILADGVLEYRNTWENPTVADGSLFQPLIGHKLACIGSAQARTIESWGNVGKCEVVGMPRFDSHANSECLPVQKNGAFRILIATANSPAFTPAQREKVLESLYLLRLRFDVNHTVNGRPVELTWRLTDGLDRELGTPGKMEFENQPWPLSDAIEMADAVITTPSTLYLESVLKRRPTAVLDFNNAPAYVPSAWTITAPAHFNPVISELENPPAAKMLFQRSVLHDQLQLEQPACSRLYYLINTMVENGAQARQDEKPLEMPMRILPGFHRELPPGAAEFDPILLYPDNPVFQVSEVHRLQLELNQAIARLDQLPRDLEQKDQDILSKNSDIARKDACIEQLTTELQELLAKKNADIEKKNQHIESLRELFESTNARVKQLRQRHVEQAELLLQMRQQMYQNTAKANNDPSSRRAA